MIPKKILLLVFACTIFSTANAQIPKLTKKDSTVVSNWLIGLGYHAVDDSVISFSGLFDIEESWNTVAYPSRISVGKYFENGLGVELIGAYSKYNKGKIVDGQILTEDKDFISFDTRLSYDLNKIIGHTGWFDPYIGSGIGYTEENDVSRATFNGVLGFKAWLSDHWGLDINTSGKWAIDSDLSNYLQHAAGVVYRFGVKKNLTKAGEEKLALINKLEEENIRINDSIANVNQVEKDRLLKEKLDRQRELESIAKLEKDKQEIKNGERKDIENALSVLDKIHFGFDSSNLTIDSRALLSKLGSILRKHPELVIEISAHTDSRGPAAYNKALSEKRLKNTINYLLEIEEIASNKVKGLAFGEEKLLNECRENVKCSEKKHRENRRSEIKILNK